MLPFYSGKERRANFTSKRRIYDSWAVFVKKRIIIYMYICIFIFKRNENVTQHKNLYTNIFRSDTHSSQKIVIIQMPIN